MGRVSRWMVAVGLAIWCSVAVAAGRAQSGAEAKAGPSRVNKDAGATRYNSRREWHTGASPSQLRASRRYRYESGHERYEDYEVHFAAGAGA